MQGEKYFCSKIIQEMRQGTSSRTFSYFLKKLKIMLKQAACSLVSIYFNRPHLAYNKNKLCKTWDCWSGDMFSFNLTENGLGLVSPLHFVYDFSRQFFLMLHSINSPNFIVWLLLLLEILGNICITSVN